MRRIEKGYDPVFGDLGEVLDGPADEFPAAREEAGEEVVEVDGDVDGDGLESLACDGAFNEFVF